MLRSSLLIPIGSFVVAVLLSILSAPSSRQVLLRAADAPTGGTPTPICAKWSMDKITVKVAGWSIRVTTLATTLVNLELALGQEATWTMVRAVVRGHRAGNPLDTFDAVPVNYVVVIDTATRLRNPNTWHMNLAVQSIAKNVIEAQIKSQYRNSQTDLLGVPILPIEVVVDGVDFLDQTLPVKTQGFVYCIKSKKFGEFVPRSVDVAVTAGAGTATN